MAISQLPQAPYRQDRKVFPTPIIGDVLFSEVRDCNRGNPFPEYGTPHPNPARWPDHMLVYVKPVDIERNEIFEFFYAAERKNQDLYNYTFNKRVIGNREFAAVTRTYITLRENFNPEDIAFGTPMPDIPEGKFDGVSYVFFDKEQQNIQQEELNSLFVLEAHSYVEAAVLDEQLSLSVEKQDPLPAKFRVLSPTTTTEELAEGEITTPTLVGDQLAATEDQINTNLKRKRTVSRSSVENTSSLSGKQVTNVLQVANVVETIVPDGTTIEASALTVDASIESLGNGQSLQRVITAPELFTSKSFSSQRPDPTPEKFRVLLPTESTEENIAGTAAAPTLVAGEIETTEQQVNAFVKRKSSTKRSVVNLPQSLTQKVTTNEKQVAVVTETLQKGDTTEAASAIVDIQSEAIGDGNYLVRKTAVPQLFTSKSFSTQKPDPTPEKFRVLIPTKSTEENITGTAIEPVLEVNEIEATEQQVNAFVKRKRSTKRDLTTLPQSLTQKVTTNEKQVAVVTETLQKGDTTESASAIVDIQSEAIGDGNYLVRKTAVPELFTSPSFSAERPDPTPEKFRILLPTRSSEVNVTGTAEAPTLAAGEIEATEQQVNAFVKRKRSTKRDTTNLPQSLTQKVTTNEKQVATVTETLQKGDTTEAASAVVDIQSEAIGDGNYLVRKTAVPELFTSKSFSSQRPDPTPEKFRVLLPTKSSEENVIGTAADPTLAVGEIEATEQQVNAFVKRKRSTKRDTTTLPQSLTQKVTTNEKQVATVTETLQKGDTTEAASAVVDIQSEAIGDGNYLVRKTAVPELFTNKSFSAQRPDPTPEKFRVLLPTRSLEENVTGTAADPTLAAGEIEATEQQVNAFVKRKRTTKRDVTNLPQSLTQKVTTNEKQIATITDTLQKGDSTEAASATVDIQSEALGDGNYLVRKTAVPQLFGSKSFSAQRPDPTPEKFRVLLPVEATEETVTGTATAPTLSAGEIEISEQQINTFVKRKRSAKRNIASLPQSLTQKVTTNEKQVATVTDTFQKGDTTEAASATVDIQSEAIGDGNYLVRKTAVPQLFTSKSFSAQRPDPTPEKFRVLLPVEATEENIAGTAAAPTLSAGQLEVSEQQINSFVKRKRSASRDVTSLPKSLTQKLTTNEKQVATITDTLQKGDTTEAASATVDIQSEALGDGNYLVRKVAVPKLFTAKSNSVQISDNIPDKFTAQYPTISTQEIKVGTAPTANLSTNEIQRTHTQQNEFVYTEQVTKRTFPTEVQLPQVEQSYVEGTIAEVTEKLSTTKTIQSGLLVVESKATPIGDGKFVVQTVQVDSWPALKSSEYDPVIDAQVVRTEQFVKPPTTFTEKNTSYRAVNKDRSLKIVETEPTSALKAYVLSFPIQVDIPLPRVLKSINIVWSATTSDGDFESEWDGFASGDSWSLSGSESGNATASISLKPELNIEIADPWGSDLPATSYYFFLETSNGSVSETTFMSRLAEVVGKSVSRWPTFKPESHSVILKGLSGAVKANASGSASKASSPDSGSYSKTQGTGKEYDISTSITAVTIPATIHGNISFGGLASQTKKIAALANIGWFGTNFPTVRAISSITFEGSADVTPTAFSATSPARIPSSGLYLIKSSVEPYKWGWVKCGAVVLNASVLA